MIFVSFSSSKFHNWQRDSKLLSLRLGSAFAFPIWRFSQISGFHVLFTRPTNYFFFKKNITLKMNLMILFTHLKIILLQCFQFSVISGIQTDTVRLDSAEKHYPASTFFIFLRTAFQLFQWVSCTVHRTHKPLFSKKFSLKMNLTTLFTHLKIILL